MKGGKVEDYKLKDVTADKLKADVTEMKGRMKTKRPVGYFKDLLSALMDRGYIRQHSKKSNHQHSVSIVYVCWKRMAFHCLRRTLISSLTQ